LHHSDPARVGRAFGECCGGCDCARAPGFSGPPVRTWSTASVVRPQSFRSMVFIQAPEVREFLLSEGLTGRRPKRFHRFREEVFPSAAFLSVAAADQRWKLLVTTVAMTRTLGIGPWPVRCSPRRQRPSPMALTRTPTKPSAGPLEQHANGREAHQPGETSAISGSAAEPTRSV
jgi:hypothetical protein